MARRLRSPALRVLIGTSVCLGATFVAVDLATVSFAQHHGGKAAAGPLLGLYGLGSAIAGVWYGTRRWKSPYASRLTVALAATALGIAPLAFMPGLWPMAAAITAAGLGISATLTSSYRVAEMAVPPGQRTEAMSWLTTAAATGTALGAPLAGRLIDLRGAPAGYLFAFAAGLAAVAIAVLRRRDLALPSGPGPDSRADRPEHPGEDPSLPHPRRRSRPPDHDRSDLKSGSGAHRTGLAATGHRPGHVRARQPHDENTGRTRSMNSREIGRITSSDGTSIAFERVGTGPGGDPRGRRGELPRLQSHAAAGRSARAGHFTDLHLRPPRKGSQHRHVALRRRPGDRRPAGAH